jgi:hypothetical protein
MSSQLFPEVRDATAIGARFSHPLFLPVGVEGQAVAAGTAVVAQPYQVSRHSEADTLFGASSLAQLVKFVMERGISPVIAIASEKAAVPTLVQRQAAWAVLESDELIRVRLTDSTAQADLVGLADSVEAADLLFNKQIAFGGMPLASDKTALTTAAAAISSKRFVLVGPGIYDDDGVLRSGAYAAAAVAAEVAKNPDIADDLDRYPLSGLTGIEVNATGVPIFRRKVVSGSVVNDFEDLLDGGVSPLMQAATGGVAITHLRMAWITDSTFDALMTRLIVDQLFIDVRDYLHTNNFLRRGNTEETRDDIRAGVDALLAERSNWIAAKMQANGIPGFKVGVASSSDGRNVTVSYEGTVVRGIQTIDIAATIEIAV